MREESLMYFLTYLPYPQCSILFIVPSFQLASFSFILKLPLLFPEVKYAGNELYRLPFGGGLEISLFHINFRRIFLLDIEF